MIKSKKVKIIMTRTEQTDNSTELDKQIEVIERFHEAEGWVRTRTLNITNFWSMIFAHLHGGELIVCHSDEDNRYTISVLSDNLTEVGILVDTTDDVEFRKELDDILGLTRPIPVGGEHYGM